MKIKATDKAGKEHNGSNIKSLLIYEETGSPLAIIKETIIGNLANYRVLTPTDKEFQDLMALIDKPITVTNLVS
jgi:hypothetical protein